MTDTADDLDAIATREELAVALTSLRERAGLSIRDLARAVGIPAATIGGYFSGRHVPGVAAVPHVREVLAACGVPPAEVEDWLDVIARVRRAPGPRRTAEMPYRGLAAFQPEDAGWFFGRERLTEVLVSTVRASTASPVIVVGASGAGKSSLLRAGLIPALATPGGDGSPSLDAILLTPGPHPSTALAAALPAAADPTRTLLVVDQLEELFTSCLSAAERTSFVEEVTALVTGGMRVVLGLRADFYGEALRFPALAAALADHQVIVGPMTVDELRSAVVQPARLASIELEPGLVDMVLDDLVGGRRGTEHDPGALPLLAHSLYETWRLGGGRRLTLAHLVE
uniref:helix-turn-helix domain-containing protein n=1 Tax=Actinotalea sp. TaxID=1872145 RepID=UPI003564DB28